MKNSFWIQNPQSTSKPAFRRQLDIRMVSLSISYIFMQKDKFFIFSNFCKNLPTKRNRTRDQFDPKTPLRPKTLPLIHWTMPHAQRPAAAPPIPALVSPPPSLALDKDKDYAATTLQPATLIRHISARSHLILNL